MPGGEEKKKEAKPPSRKAQRAATKRQKGSERLSNLVLDKYRRGNNATIKAAIVLRAAGSGHFDVITEDGETHTHVGIRGSLKLGRKAIRAQARTAVEPGSVVLLDGGRIGSVLTGEDQRKLMSKFKVYVRSLAKGKNLKMAAAAEDLVGRLERLGDLGVGAAPEGFSYSGSRSRSSRSRSSTRKSKSKSKSGSRSSRSRSSRSGVASKSSSGSAGAAKRTATRKAGHKSKKAAQKREAVAKKEIAATAAKKGLNLFKGNNARNAFQTARALAEFEHAKPEKNATRRRPRNNFPFAPDNR